MSMSHNQMAYVAIVSTMIFGSLFVGASGFFQTSEGAGDFDPAAEDDLIGEGSNTGESKDSDGDGLVDAVEAQYGTDPFDPDTDKDTMSDGWEVANGLNPLDNGESDDAENDPSEANSEGAEEQEEEDSWPDPDDGPKGDPDRDGLINSVEILEGTNPRLADSDGDGLNDKWEVTYKREVFHPAGNFTLFDPLSANWDCPELTDAMLKQSLEDHFNGENGVPEWNDLANTDGEHSCDQVLDSDNDKLFNLEEESYGTDPTKADSDGDMLDDIHEISDSTIMIMMATGQNCGVDLLDPVSRAAPFAADALEHGLAWFKEDMDGDGQLNGPSDWDTDGDGMPDGFEFCFADVLEHPLTGAIAASQTLDPANNSDGYGDWDEDGMNNIEEYQVALAFGESKFTSPWHEDTDEDGMPDGWEATNGLDPRDGSNGDIDSDRDGYDADGDGAVTFSTLENVALVVAIDVELDDWVTANETVARARITLSGGNQQVVPLVAPVDGYVYSINVEVGDTIESRLDVWLEIVEIDEMFTNLMEYNARDSDGDGIIDGRSTDPLNPDTDGDGLKDGIEVIGWDILVVNRGVCKMYE